MKRDADHLIESTGSNIIESAINLLNKISSTYDADTASDLERKFINSIKTGDPRKFKRSVKKVIENKQGRTK